MKVTKCLFSTLISSKLEHENFIKHKKAPLFSLKLIYYFSSFIVECIKLKYDSFIKLSFYAMIKQGMSPHQGCDNSKIPEISEPFYQRFQRF